MWVLAEAVGSAYLGTRRLTKLFMDAPPKSRLRPFGKACRTYHQWEINGCGGQCTGDNVTWTRGTPDRAGSCHECAYPDRDSAVDYFNDACN